ncbi:MAG TPA: aldo/keto reductase [Mobilitalea sp.]|nr:aldo/keto reductase [Mobilitalea sp.]
MEYRNMGKLGIQTSLLGFGCMRFPKHKDGSIDKVKSEQMIDTAYKNGVNYFDTAYNYHDGASESFIGEALDKYDRNSYFLATKLPQWLVKSVDDAERIFKEQLDRLHKEYVDFYLIHAIGRESFDRMVSLGILEFLDRLKAEGKIRYIGFSFHDGYDAFEHILKFRDWDFCQIQLNYIDTENQAGMKGYELTEKLNVPLIIMEPVKGGSLAKLPESAAKHFNKIAPDKSMASWALRYVASLPNVKLVLSGMTTELQVSDNLDTFNDFKELNEVEQKAVQAAVEVLKKGVKNGCTSCSYCMPCPAGVDIPGNFRIWNSHGMYNNVEETKWLWSNDIDVKAKANNCIECGQCETLCPQKISIRNDLKQLQTELDLIM